MPRKSDRYRSIYILRSQCEHQPHDPLDKMDTFYIVENATRREMFKQMKEAVVKVFAMTYGCYHPVTFTEEREREYVWDTKENKPTLIAELKG